MKFSGRHAACESWICCSVRCPQRISFCAEDSALYSTTIRAYGRIPYPLAPAPNASAAELADTLDAGWTIRAQICEVEATEAASESELNLTRHSDSPGTEPKNRGHLRVHAGATTRALREGTTTRNVEPRPTSQGHVVLARRYVQVGGDLRSVRKHQDGASFAYGHRQRRIDDVSPRIVNAD